MSERKFTTGPWMLSGRTVYALNDQGFNRFSALVQDAHTSAVELDANARLIAAAPELLEALECALAQCLAWQGEPNDEWSCPIHVAVCKRARAAIAKATGESK